MNMKQLKRNNKLYFSDGTKEFLNDRYYKIFSLDNKHFLITKTQPWGHDKDIYTVKPIIKNKIDVTLATAHTLKETLAYIKGYLHTRGSIDFPSL